MCIVQFFKYFFDVNLTLLQLGCLPFNEKKGEETHCQKI